MLTLPMKPLAMMVCIAAFPAFGDDLLVFQSPSGNIHCVIALGEGATARCDMIALMRSYRQPPDRCDLDWGASFTIGLLGRKGELACVGDSVISNGSMVLEYDKTVSRGGFECSSQKSGMTCTNPAGHGFTISRGTQQLF